MNLINVIANSVWGSTLSSQNPTIRYASKSFAEPLGINRIQNPKVTLEISTYLTDPFAIAYKRLATPLIRNVFHQSYPAAPFRENV